MGKGRSTPQAVESLLAQCYQATDEQLNAMARNRKDRRRSAARARKKVRRAS